MFKVNDKDSRMTSVTYSYFIPFSSASIVDIEQVNVYWKGHKHG